MADITRGITGARGGRKGAFGLELTGVAELQRKLAIGLWQRVQKATETAITEASEDLLSKAQAVVPHDEGTLEASGSVLVLSNGRPIALRGPHHAAGQPRPGVVEGIVGFNMPYALEQHERLDYQHAEGRKAKYLEDPLKENAAAYQRNIENHLRGALARP